MSDSTSDTESSCGWTIISNEGSDIETIGPENCGTEVIPDLPVDSSSLIEGNLNESSVTSHAPAESIFECSHIEGTLSISEEADVTLPDDQVVFGSSSDHSDIVTLEPELVVWETNESLAQDNGINEELDLGSSSSSQYTFNTPDAVKQTESSSDEKSGQSTPVLRRRRLRKTTVSNSEDNEIPLEEQQQEQESHDASQPPQPVGGTLNRCILLALVIAISMGFGHFYGTVQILERNRVVKKIHEDQLNDVKDDLYQCQKEQDMSVESKKIVGQLSEDLEEKRDMVLSLTGIMDKISKENQQLRMKQAELQEEESLSTLQEELRNLRMQIQNLEEKGTNSDHILTENQMLKEYLKEEKQQIQNFLNQKENLMAEAQMLRLELDKERQVTNNLKEELGHLRQASSDMKDTDPETEELQARLAELEKKLNFEQQRSDLWERLYVEMKEGQADTSKPKKSKGESVFTSVKNTFDAVKNSTKEFVHHHKEQIKKAKEAVKENLKKFSDSVKSTFRHFRDSATNIFDKNWKAPINRAQGRNVGQPCQHVKEQSRDGEDEVESLWWQNNPQKPCFKHQRKSTANADRDYFESKYEGQSYNSHSSDTRQKTPKGCSDVFDCAYQESMSLFNKAIDPVKADEFIQLMHRYVQQEVNHFHHWRELENFINRFFHNGIFIHDQMLFTDFVSGVEDYLEDMKEYQKGGKDVFEDLDEYVYMYFFGETYSQQHGPSRPFEGPFPKNERLKKSEHKPQRHHMVRSKERKWNKEGYTKGRHMTDVKTELGPTPFDLKY
ncbi:cell cycle progression protein 1 isoform X2 [Erpetoichthys calabaricus]|uniref:cell cycle progression protein 1 isoform X2 n=1 Tax=Erpetoichthys calabaricus TaxID=27687 RepID=UPI0022344710|nr:cell cycle progression protein 1 isoform X2 [Erpetoichthys calabaricus]